MRNPQPNLDDILRSFFRERLECENGVVRRRTLRVERLLRDCVETVGEEMMATRERVVLAAEREFGTDGAVARTLCAEDLVVLLTAFVQPPWLHAEPAVLREQLAVVGALTEHLLREDLVSYEDAACVLLDIRVGLSEARRELKRGHSSPRSGVTPVVGAAGGRPQDRRG